jgi:hypothetical protein
VKEIRRQPGRDGEVEEEEEGEEGEEGEEEESTLKKQKQKQKQNECGGAEQRERQLRTTVGGGA